MIAASVRVTLLPSSPYLSPVLLRDVVNLTFVGLDGLTESPQRWLPYGHHHRSHGILVYDARPGSFFAKPLEYESTPIAVLCDSRQGNAVVSKKANINF